MRKFRRQFLAWLSLSGLLATLLAPASASADAFTSWTAGPDGVLDPTYDGFIDIPSMNATVPPGNFTVAGWFLDKTAEGWSGADDVQIWQGTMDGGGRMLAKAAFAQNRPDVAAAEGTPYWAASGFSGVVPGAALAAGQQALSVYAHTPGKGWWYKQVQVNVSTTAAAAAPGAPAAAAPTVSGGAPPTVVVEVPTDSANIKTKPLLFTMSGYALDKNAAPTQGVQGTGIDSVSVYIDAERDKGGTSLGTADLAFSDPVAQKAYGDQFANSGWRLTFKPTSFHKGQHTLFVYTHSVVTGKENLTTISINIVETG